jgi:hypothetical protein
VTRARVRGLEEEAPAAADLVERQGDHEIGAAAQVRDAAHERGGAEVVGAAGDAALLGAGDRQPDVAAGIERSEATGERREDADARGVVVRAGHAGERVDVGHEDRQAAGRRVEGSDQVA